MVGSPQYKLVCCFVSYWQWRLRAQHTVRMRSLFCRREKKGLEMEMILSICIMLQFFSCNFNQFFTPPTLAAANDVVSVQVETVAEKRAETAIECIYTFGICGNLSAYGGGEGNTFARSQAHVQHFPRRESWEIAPTIIEVVELFKSGFSPNYSNKTVRSLLEIWALYRCVVNIRSYRPHPVRYRSKLIKSV